VIAGGARGRGLEGIPGVAPGAGDSEVEGYCGVLEGLLEQS
jgi:hypothetical protein